MSLLDTGLLSVLGLNTFKELLGINYINPCYNCFTRSQSLGFVVDDKGSMNGDIKDAAQRSIEIVNHAVLVGSNGTSDYVLSTFNDSGL